MILLEISVMLNYFCENKKNTFILKSNTWSLEKLENSDKQEE